MDGESHRILHLGNVLCSNKVLQHRSRMTIPLQNILIANYLQRLLNHLFSCRVFRYMTGSYNHPRQSSLKVFSRCKSKLVILGNEEYFERFVSKDHHSNNNALKIPISGIFVKKWANPGLFFIYFRSFQTNNTIFTTYQCDKMYCPFRIRRRDSNPQPLDVSILP